MFFLQVMSTMMTYQTLEQQVLYSLGGFVSGALVEIVDRTILKKPKSNKEETIIWGGAAAVGFQSAHAAIYKQLSTQPIYDSLIFGTSIMLGKWVASYLPYKDSRQLEN